MLGAGFTLSERGLGAGTGAPPAGHRGPPPWESAMKRLPKLVSGWHVSTFLLTVFMLVSLGVYSTARYGSLTNAIRFAKGQRLFIDPPAGSVSGAAAGGERQVDFRITNVSSRPVSFTGVRMSCSCVTVQALPTSVPANLTIPFSVKVDLSKRKPGEVVNEYVLLYTDNPGQPTIGMGVNGSVSGERTERRAD
jgi:hypothetical protein